MAGGEVAQLWIFYGRTVYFYVTPCAFPAYYSFGKSHEHGLGAQSTDLRSRGAQSLCPLWILTGTLGERFVADQNKPSTGIDYWLGFSSISNFLPIDYDLWWEQRRFSSKSLFFLLPEPGTVWPKEILTTGRFVLITVIWINTSS